MKTKGLIFRKMAEEEYNSLCSKEIKKAKKRLKKLIFKSLVLHIINRGAWYFVTCIIFYGLKIIHNVLKNKSCHNTSIIFIFLQLIAKAEVSLDSTDLFAYINTDKP